MGKKNLKDIFNWFTMKVDARGYNPPVSEGDVTTSPKDGFINHAADQYAREVTVATQQGADNGGTLFSDLIRTIYSREIEYKALPRMMFMQFATIATELNVQPGLTISMLTYDNLKPGGALEENRKLATQAMTGSMRQLTVTEWGNAVSNSEKLLLASFDNVMERTTTLLGRDYALVVDMELRDAALSGTNIVYARKGDGTANEAREDLDDTSTLKVSTIKDGLEVLSTNLATPIDGYWVCAIHPHQSRTLRDDPAWIQNMAA